MPLEQKKIEPWQTDKSYESEMRIELHDKIHSIPKYSAVVSLSMEFTVFIFTAYHHLVYKQQKRSVQNLDIAELLQRIENLTLCKGLTEDEDILSVATDLTGSPNPNPITIVRHTVPKAIQVEEPHFEVTLNCISVSCL